MKTLPVDKKILWISIYHPGEIINAVGLSLFFQDKYKINLLIKGHPYWQGMSDVPYKKYFNNIFRFPDVGFSKHFVRQALRIYRIKKSLRALCVKKDDIFLTLSNKSFVDNIFLSIYTDIHTVKLVCREECIDSITDFYSKNNQYKEIFTSKIWNLTLLPLFDLEPIVFVENVKDKGLYEIVYKKGDRQIFKKMLFLKNYGGDTSTVVDEIYNFFPFVKEKLSSQAGEENKKLIIFFGEGRNFYDEYHFTFTSKCLRYIETFFPNHRYIYKPHPGDRGNFEQDNIELGKFEVYHERTITELLLLEHMSAVEFCFSISSTSLRRSLDFGIPSYYFLNLYKKYSAEYYDTMIRLAGPVRSDAFLDSFENPPVTYQLNTDYLKQFNSEIYKLLVA